MRTAIVNNNVMKKLHPDDYNKIVPESNTIYILDPNYPIQL